MTEFSSGWQGCSSRFPLGFALGNPLEQSCQPSENLVHPSSFTWINPILVILKSQDCDLSNYMEDWPCLWVKYMNDDQSSRARLSQYNPASRPLALRLRPGALGLKAGFYWPSLALLLGLYQSIGHLWIYNSKKCERKSIFLGCAIIIHESLIFDFFLALMT